MSRVPTLYITKFVTNVITRHVTKRVGVVTKLFTVYTVRDRHGRTRTVTVVVTAITSLFADRAAAVQRDVLRRLESIMRRIRA